MIYAELMALYLGLTYCKNMNLYPIWAEMDALAIVLLVQRQFCHNTDLFYLFRTILKIIKELNVKVSHIFREGNACIDWLANRASAINMAEEFWPHNIQFDLKNLIRMDNMGIPYLRYS